MKLSSNPGSCPKFGGPKISFAGRLVLYWLPVLGLSLIIFFMSSFPSVETKVLFDHQDKIIHLMIYGLLAYLAARALKTEMPRLNKKSLFLWAAGFGALFGLSDEIHQAFVPGRVAGVGDWLADFTGSLAGAGLFTRPLKTDLS
ncbi:MAG: VanZ family protein [Desulfobacter sp.]|nr:MAG: VanZ family protein [Desulfobacter sp.]